jgi:DNA-binding beta-propeller fold protein YncE
VSLCLIIFGWLGFRWYLASIALPVPTQSAGTVPYSGPNHLRTIYGNEGVFLGESRSVYVSGRRIYISDTSNHRIVVLDYNGNLLHQFGDLPQGEWPGLKYPYGLVVVGERIYVADAGAMKLVSFDLEGNFTGYFAEDVLHKPINIVFRDNHFYLTDVARQQIVVLDGEGNEVNSFGRYGKEGAPDEFNYPNGLVLDKEGRIYVADTNNSRIQIFDRNGKYLATWRDSSSSGGGMIAPMNIAFDGNNRLYVTDPIANRILVFDGNGDVSEIIRQVPEEKGSGTLALPSGIYIDSNQRLFISDTGNQRLVVFEIK